MAEYLSPGVYVEDNPGLPVIEAVSSSTGGFIGTAERGPVGKPVFITSWNAFVREFASGMSSPFLKDSYLAYSVYGFFQNGGKRCYVMRVAENALSSESNKTYTDDSEAIPIMKAKDEGAWGNKIKVSILENEDNSSYFDIKVHYDDVEVEVIDHLSNEVDDSDYWVANLDFRSNFIDAVGGSLATTLVDKTDDKGNAIKVDEPIVFANGSDGEEVIDNTFIQALDKFDTTDDLNLLCIPGETSVQVNNALMSYCENRKYVFAILDAPKFSDVQSVKELRKGMSCKNAALYFPWIKVTDPLSKTGRLKDCPTCGHIMGVYARTIEERGVWKAPAGTETLVRGAIEVLTTVTQGDTDILNPAGIVSILPKPNYGIVIWGARDLHPDSSMKYISDVLLDINIKKSIYLGTQQFVFEPNDHHTWRRIKTTIEAFLDNMWRDGALFGEKASEAYYVKCDEDLNPKNVRDAGKLICEVGYASKKPAEFVIFRFSHEVAAQ